MAENLGQWVSRSVFNFHVASCLIPSPYLLICCLPNGYSWPYQTKTKEIHHLHWENNFRDAVQCPEIANKPLEVLALYQYKNAFSVNFPNHSVVKFFWLDLIYLGYVWTSKEEQILDNSNLTQLISSVYLEPFLLAFVYHPVVRMVNWPNSSGSLFHNYHMKHFLTPDF